MMSSSMRWVRGAAVAMAGTLAACSSMAEKDLSPGAILSGGRDAAAEQQALAEFAPVAVCPEVQVRDGTQMMVIYEKGKQGDPNAIRFQGTIQRFARECQTDRLTGITSIKVGVAGRLLSGRSGATGTVSLPLRVALLRNGDELVYSKLHPVSATINTGESAFSWTQVVQDIQIPREIAQSRFVIYVGFDEGSS